MRLTIVVVIFFAVIAMAFGNPLDFDEQNFETEPFSNDPTLVRNKRLTCDILGSTPACAAHCIARGYRGGWCDGKSVCNCRR
ncbi:U-Asilidin(12)-Dg3a [Chironomus tepperi]|uniref:U-Asilidin(12)-Dg3a n=1 Tax=Chironomus tepperi TaxID=113505 RepID=UPI00391EE5A4